MRPRICNEKDIRESAAVYCEDSLVTNSDLIDDVKRQEALDSAVSFFAKILRAPFVRKGKPARAKAEGQKRHEVLRKEVSKMVKMRWLQEAHAINFALEKEFRSF